MLGTSWELVLLGCSGAKSPLPGLGSSGQEQTQSNHKPGINILLSHLGGREGKELLGHGRPGLGSGSPGCCPTGESTQVTIKVNFSPSHLIFLSLRPAIKNLESNLKGKEKKPQTGLVSMKS